MSSGSLARRYAKAILEIGEEQKNLDKLGGELRDFAKAMVASEELTATLTNPLFPRSDREKVLLAILLKVGASTPIKNVCLILLDRERLAAVPAIARELDEMIDERIGRVAAEVTSATLLSPSQEAAIRQELEKLSGRKVEMKTSQDPELLGGVVAKVGDLVYDGSLRTQLRKLRDQLAS